MQRLELKLLLSLKKEIIAQAQTLLRKIDKLNNVELTNILIIYASYFVIFLLLN
jgi:hypothetical protein